MKKSERGSKQKFDVLLIEDDSIYQNRLKELICDAISGVNVVAKESCEEGRQALAPEMSWDLLVTDIGLPNKPPASERTEEQIRADDKEMLGRRLVKLAYERGIKCIVATATAKMGENPLSESAKLKRKYKVVEVFSKVTLKDDEDLFRICVRDTLSSNQKEAMPRVNKVIISHGEDNFVFKAQKAKDTDDFPAPAVDFPVPPDLLEVIRLFGKKIVEKGALETVPWRQLNEAAAKEGDKPYERHKVSDRLKKLLWKFNTDLMNDWARTPNGKRWIVTVPKTGAHLNKSVQWFIDRRATERIGKDPPIYFQGGHEMGKYTEDKNQPLPEYEEYEEFDEEDDEDDDENDD